jgi:hypothetical protein
MRTSPSIITNHDHDTFVHLRPSVSDQKSTHKTIMKLVRASSGLLARISRATAPKPSLLFAGRTFSSSSEDWVQTNIDEETGIAIVTLNRPPANSLSMEM